MRIKAIYAKNFKGLKEISITPGPHIVIIGGRNAQGKSSTMDVVSATLGGKKAMKQIERPIRDGEEYAETIVETDEFTAKRVWKGDKSTLSMELKNGAKLAAPQEYLDRLVGSLSFDPLEFTRLAPKDQVTKLLEVVELPINLEAIAAQRAALYLERTEVGRDVKRLEGQFAGFAEPEPFLPEEEESVAELLEQFQAINMTMQYRHTTQGNIDRQKQAILRLETELADAKHALGLYEIELAECGPIGDMDALQTRLDNAESTNAKIRENKQRLQVGRELDEARAKYAAGDDGIAALDQLKADALANAVFPVPGLGFTDDGVTYHGIPLEQVSSSEQIKVSLGVAMALNPELRIVRILDGSLLDDESLGLIAETAEEKDYQVFIERVGSADEGALVIEDGMVQL